MIFEHVQLPLCLISLIVIKLARSFKVCGHIFFGFFVKKFLSFEKVRSLAKSQSGNGAQYAKYIRREPVTTFSVLA